ncbi:unnamed protein product [Leptidea sinapis]|nr:unnamed protein product [Leptidea sinapis]
MATWMRLAYPHLVDVAFSDSGPLYAQEDFPEYLEVITESLVRQGSQACVDTISLSISTMVELLKSDAGAREVSSLFNTCTEIRPNVSLDISTFFWYGITETFAELPQSRWSVWLPGLLTERGPNRALSLCACGHIKPAWSTAGIRLPVVPDSHSSQQCPWRIKRTNLLFGGMRLPDHVLSVAGGIDPCTS